MSLLSKWEESFDVFVIKNSVVVVLSLSRSLLYKNNANILPWMRQSDCLLTILSVKNPVGMTYSSEFIIFINILLCFSSQFIIFINILLCFS